MRAFYDALAAWIRVKKEIYLCTVTFEKPMFRNFLPKFSLSRATSLNLKFLPTVLELLVSEGKFGYVTLHTVDSL